MRIALTAFFLSFIQVCLPGQPGIKQYPDFPPDNVSSQMDRDQMLWQLGITLPELPPRIADPNRPQDARPVNDNNTEGNWTDYRKNTITRSPFGLWNNYSDRAEGFFPGADSARLGNYTPIDLLRTNSGDIVSSPDEWWNVRRSEIFRDLQEHLYGKIPHDSILPAVSWSVETTMSGTGSEAYIQKTITGTIDVSRYPQVRNKPVISATLRTPQNATEGVPVIIFFGGFGNANDLYWKRSYPEGWGTCIFNLNLLQPDNGTGLTSFLIGLVNKGNWRKPDDWGTLAAWSWGVSRLIDYLETDKHVNSKIIALTGHSRYGKATLVTMAYEPRVAIGFPSDAGSLGTKMNRRHWGQDLEHSTGTTEYHWMAGNFFRWAGEKAPGQYLPRKIEDCPVDAHSLLALCAPRPVFINGGTNSSWCDPFGMYLTAREASPVYRFLGSDGFVMPHRKPLADTAYILGSIGFRYHNGGHTDAPDWPAFFKFAAKHFTIPVLDVSASSLVFDSWESLETRILITSSEEASVTPSDYWIRAADDEKSDSTVIEVLENRRQPSADFARSGFITVSIRGRKQIIYVHQATVKPTLELSQTDIFLEAKEGSRASFDIFSNSAWSVTTDDDWFTLSDEAGINDKRIVLTASANNRVQQRTGTIRVRAPGYEQVLLLSVVQKEAIPEITVSPSSVKLEAVPGSAAVMIFSNTPWELNNQCSWVKSNVASGEGTRQVLFTAAENTSPSARSCQVSIIANGVKPRFIEIVQRGRE